MKKVNRLTVACDNQEKGWTEVMGRKFLLVGGFRGLRGGDRGDDA